MKMIKNIFIVFLAVFCLNANAQNRIVRRGQKIIEFLSMHK